ncbi:PREDICTED: E3 ubiquitin-protein ligase TRIM71-like [Amphimedon queenslandica]|uniref:Uncharacterized protein n=1 Tax=Amphimedon queenslandica TaxID=400682 RepID=A0A1X7SV21_AMPQE|nr:PREDICTED: E3 ubiquitin-protein ligase TRIM71-like [Amphimedon queenslandica]|eukprot:XP_011408778.1 PREDICTED: E3 ubiquitin-protein ligase TRIM71-like [Amphimedon queenslandica]
MASNEVVPSNSIVIDPMCTICHKLYKEPLLLSCLHSFCKKCLLKHIDKEVKTDGGNRHVHCPTCEQRTVLSSNGEEASAGLPINLRLSHLAEVTSYKKKMDSKVSCDRCDNKGASSFCANCCMFMCDTCKADHQRWKELRTHEVIELESIKKKEGQSLRIQHPPQICQDHKKEEMRFYCLDDEELVCRDCLMTTHNGHKRDYLEKVAKSEQEDLKKVMPDITSAMGQLDKAIAAGKKMEKKIKASSKKALTSIDGACEDLVKAVRVRQEALHERCKGIDSGKEEVLQAQIHEFEKLKNILTFLDETMNDAVNNHTPEELLTVKKVVKAQVTRVLDNFSRFLLDLQENEIINTSLEVGPIIDSIESLGYFPGVPHLECCTIEGLGVQEALVGKERVFKVILRDEKNKPLEGNVLFQYELINKDDADAPLPKVSITQSEKQNDGCATLSITVPNSGEYQLKVKIRNVPLVTTDPFRMWAHPPRDYKKEVNPDAPIATLPLQKSASRGIAIDYATGLLYASDYDNHTVMVLQTDGEVYKQIGGNDNAGGNLSNPWGVVVANDTLYVVSSNSHKVKMYALSGDFIGEFGENGNGPEQFDNPRGIACDNEGHLFIADYGNDRILVLTMQGKAVSSIKPNAKPVDVAVGVNGSIHAALESNTVPIHTRSDNGEWNKAGEYNAGGNATGITIDCEGYKMVTISSDKMNIIAPNSSDVLKTCPNVSRYGVARDSQGFIYVSHNNKTEMLKY